MKLWEVVFKLRSGSCLLDLSSLYPQNTFVMWYVWNRQLLKFNSVGHSEVENIAKFLKKSQFVVEKTKESEDETVLLINVLRDEDLDVWDIAASRNCLELPPAVFRNGIGTYRFAGFEEREVKSLITDIQGKAEVEVVRKKQLPLNVIRSSLWTSSILNSFTKRQAQCLIAAQSMGYYGSPRRATTGTVAKSVGITRSTFETHLRKAENIIINSFVPYLQLFNVEEKTKDFHHRTLLNAIEES